MSICIAEKRSSIDTAFVPPRNEESQERRQYFVHFLHNHRFSFSRSLSPLSLSLMEDMHKRDAKLLVLDEESSSSDESSSTYFENFSAYIGVISWSDGFLGTCGWQYVAMLLDSLEPHPGVEFYIFRCAVVALFEATMAALATLVLSDKFNLQNCAKLWICIFFAGALWQVETDFATYIANQPDRSFKFLAKTHSILDVFVNFIVFTIFHSIFFMSLTRLCRCGWTNWIIGFQFGFGAFGFYFSNLFNIHWLNRWSPVLFAGFCSFLFSLVPPIFYQAYRGINKWTKISDVPFLKFRSTTVNKCCKSINGWNFDHRQCHLVWFLFPYLSIVFSVMRMMFCAVKRHIHWDRTVLKRAFIYWEYIVFYIESYIF